MKQEQFLSVLSRDDAQAAFRRYLDLRPLPAEDVPLDQALGRVLACDVAAPVDVPGFHRSNVDGFAVVAGDTYGADEESPVSLRLTGENVAAGDVPVREVRPGTATPTATGAVVPRGASAVVMVEFTDLRGDTVLVYRAASPGDCISHAGSDMMQGEIVLRAGQGLGSRETGTLAAMGVASVPCVRRPRVAILSSGNELVAPGSPVREGQIYDSNSRLVADAVRENGGDPVFLGMVPDDEAKLEAAIREGLRQDLLVVSGGTSKGAGDLNYRVLERLGPPGILVHGVALKPGKPLCLAIVQGKPVVILPGFPTSAIVTFSDFVLPVIRCWAGLPPASRRTVQAEQAIRYHSEKGRMEYAMVHLVLAGGRLRAYPQAKGSGAVTAFGQADGFLRIPAQQEMVLEGTTVDVELFGEIASVPALTSIGSHCVGLDYLLSEVRRVGFAVKAIPVGSLGGLDAARRGESSVSGVHLLDEGTGEYNLPFLKAGDGLVLVRGYVRRQGILTRRGHLSAVSVERLLERHMAGEGLILVNRNRGSGTRILTDLWLRRAAEKAGLSWAEVTHSIRGYEIEARSHNAIAASVATGKADWGVGIETVARDRGLEFHHLDDERFDFVIPGDRMEDAAVRVFLEILRSGTAAEFLRRMGFVVGPDLGQIVSRDPTNP